MQLFFNKRKAYLLREKTIMTGHPLLNRIYFKKMEDYVYKWVGPEFYSLEFDYNFNNRSFCYLNLNECRQKVVGGAIKPYRPQTRFFEKFHLENLSIYTLQGDVCATVGVH